MNTGEWMTENGIDKWLLANSPKQTDRVVWQRCTKAECDQRPFKVTQSDIDDADGWIACDVCGEPCEECDAPDWANDRTETTKETVMESSPYGGMQEVTYTYEKIYQTRDYYGKGPVTYCTSRVWRNNVMIKTSSFPIKD